MEGKGGGGTRCQGRSQKFWRYKIRAISVLFMEKKLGTAGKNYALKPVDACWYFWVDSGWLLPQDHYN